MAGHVSPEELSAYLDGEALNPSHINRHLQQCAQCAQHHVELAKLSSHLQALPSPDVTNDFTSRVLGAVQQAKDRPMPTWRKHALVPLAAAATLLVLSMLYTAFQDEKAVPNPEMPIMTYAVPNDAQALVEELERRLANAPDIDLTLDEAYLDDMVYLETSTDDMLLALANTEWFEAIAQGWEPGQDFDDVLIDLSQDETEALAAILTESTQEG